GAWDVMLYFIVALPEPSVYLFWVFQSRQSAMTTATSLHVAYRGFPIFFFLIFGLKYRLWVPLVAVQPGLCQTWS
ncbi:MAG: hypothetical protein JAY84_11105, partial [Candidatus Thiodiazotropha taylori]|nr:hypothetical protein [Candidatus Thiodiazotropha taylori]